MRFSYFASLFLLLLALACRPVRPPHLVKGDHNLDTANCKLPGFFSPEQFRKAIFKAAMNVKDYHLTGLIFIKLIPDTGYRIVFCNEFGMTYFDMEVGHDLFRLNHCFEPMNKTALWKIMETDFMLLLSPDKQAIPLGYAIQKGSGFRVCKSRQGNITRWDLFHPSGDTLAEVRGRSNPSDHTQIGFQEYREGFPSRIVLSNPFIRLYLSLSLLSLN